MKAALAVISLLALCSAAFLWPFMLKGRVPLPGDLIIGAYYPWLNSKWGYSTGVAVKNPGASDAISQFYPWRKSVIDALRVGELPLWNRTYFFGSTLIGNVQAGIFNPVNLIFLLPLSFSIAWGLQVLTQPLLAMIGMYALLRSWGRSRLAGTLGSLAYGFSAPMLVWLEYNVHGFIFAAFPMLLYYIHRGLRHDRRYLLWTSPLVAFGLFAGYPQMMYYVIGLSGLYGVWLIRKLDVRLIHLFAALILGVGLAAIQLLPGWQTLAQSIRDVDVVAQSFQVDRLPASHLLLGLIPDFFGNPATYNYQGTGTYESFAFYTSLVALMLASVTLWRKPRPRQITFLWLVVLLALLYALGTPATAWVNNLAWLGLKGSTFVRILFAYSFAVSALAAYGFDALQTAARFPRRLAVIPLFLGVVLGLAYSLQQTTSWRNTLWPSLIAVGTMASLALLRRQVHLLGVALGLLLFVDMFRFGAKYLPFVASEQVFPDTPTTRWLAQQPKPFRVAFQQAELFPAISWSPYGIEGISGSDILVPKSTTDLVSEINHGQPGLEKARFLDIKSFDSPLLDAANTKYVVLLDKGPDNTPRLSPDRYRRVFTEDKVQVWENANDLGRFVASDDCRLAVTDYSPRRARLDVTCKQAGQLFISELYNPDWKIYTNGQRTRVYRANRYFMGISLPPGPSQIELEFFPDLLLAGAFLSLAGLILWLHQMATTRLAS